MQIKEKAPVFTVVQTDFDGVGSLGMAPIAVEDYEYPKFLLEKAENNFPLIEEMFGKFGFEIPDNWQVGDMLSYLITMYAKALDKRLFEAEEEITDKLNITIFPPAYYESKPVSQLSFEVIKLGAIYKGEIRVPSQDEDKLEILAGLPVTVRKTVEIPLSERISGQGHLQTISLTGSELFERREGAETLTPFAREVLLPQSLIKINPVPENIGFSSS